MPFFAIGKSLENYEYDATGNIVSIKQSDQSLAIYSFSPAFGPVGAIVTIHGNLFSGVPEQNAVSFNGTSASILSATESALIVRVPQGATTGLVSVTVQGNTASSENDFVVTEDGGGPVIYDFWPKCGAAGTTVTVRGDQFNPDANTTYAGINGNLNMANVSNAKKLSFIAAPQNVSTGRVQVTTPLGTVSSSEVFFIPPNGSGLTCSNARDIFSIEESIEIVFAANQKYALLFEAAAGDLLSLQISEKQTTPRNAEIRYEVYDPDRAFIAYAGTYSHSGTLHLPRLAKAGIYTLLFYTTQNSPARFRVRLERDLLISADAEPSSFSVDDIGQTRRVAFYAEAGQSLGFALSQISYIDPRYENQAVRISIFGPDGRAYQSNIYLPVRGDCFLFQGAMCDLSLPIIKTTGLYTVIITQPASTVIQARANLSNNIQGTLVYGQSLMLNMNKVGQDAWLSFEGTTGQNTVLSFTDIQQSDQIGNNAFIPIRVFRPGGEVLWRNTNLQGIAGQLDLGILPESGAYRILISPSYGSRASMAIMLN